MAATTPLPLRPGERPNLGPGSPLPPQDPAMNSPYAEQTQTLAPIAMPAGASPDEVARQLEAGKSLIPPDRPIKHWTQGVGDLVGALMGGRVMRKAREAEEEGRGAAASQTEAYINALLGAAPGQRAGIGNVGSFLSNPWIDQNSKQVAMALLGEKQPAPPEMQFIKGEDGDIFAGNPQTGELNTAYDAPTPGPKTRPATPEELQAAGINVLPGENWVFDREEGYKRITDAGLLTPEQMAQKEALARAGKSETNVNTNIDNAKLTEGQSKDINFYARGIRSNAALDKVDASLVDLPAAIWADAPLFGNYGQTPEFRQAKRAAAEVLAVILRKDTGAAVTPQEFAIYGPMYLPVPGDDAATVQEKREARAYALKSIKLGLGTARPLADQIDTEMEADTPAPAAPQAPPQPGEIRDGYEYQGGNPGDPNNWKQVF